MRNINRVIVTGNLTRDADLRSTASGTAVMNIGIAVNDARKNQQTGEWEEYANFLDCTMFGERAAKLAPMMTKGTRVAIEGRLHWNQWERDGQRRSKIEIIIDQVEFMARKEAQPEPQYCDDGIRDSGYANSDVPF